VRAHLSEGINRTSLSLCFVLSVSWALPCICPADLPELELISVLPIIGPMNNQPSGLTIHDGRLVTVSDKHDSHIYELKMSETVAEQIPLMELAVDSLPDRHGILDLEGITVDSSGSLLLVSESHFRVIQVSDKHLTWLTPSLQEAGMNVGLFKTRGAFFEGIVFIDNKFFLSGERQPRGIVEYDLETKRSVAHVVNETRFPLRIGRSPDFAGMYYFQDRMFVLHRNAHVISELVFEGGEWKENEGYSFDRTENDERYAYSIMIYGRAEGLAMDEDRVYVESAHKL